MEANTDYPPEHALESAKSFRDWMRDRSPRYAEAMGKFEDTVRSRAHALGLDDEDCEFVRSMSESTRTRFLEIVRRGGVQGGSPEGEGGDNDGAGAADSGGGDDGGSGNVDGGPSDAERLLAEAEERTRKLQEKINASERKDKERAEAAKRKKAEEEGKLKELTAEQATKLEKLEAEYEKLLKIQQSKAEKSLDALGEDRKARLMAFKEKVPFDVWLEMVEDATKESPIVTPGEASPPQITGGSGVGANMPKANVLSKEGRKIIAMNGFDPDTVQEVYSKLQVQKSGNITKFVQTHTDLLKNQDRYSSKGGWEGRDRKRIRK